ncbi:MAG: M18 family aminopeptidase [Duncaniella sp.]|nr:M18 family aminopeptidase [Duncaniella sp.]
MNSEIIANAKALMSFLDRSPVNFLAVQTVSEMLDAAGFQRLAPEDPWTLEPDGRYYMTVNSSALFAFIAPSAPADPAAGFRIIAAHSDSPTLRIKPKAEMRVDGLLKLNVEVYGGPILNTWFDRPLSLAGRVVVRGESPLHPLNLTVCFDRPLLTIPNLAIHFNRQVNDGYKISAQKDMLPIAAIVGDKLDTDGRLLRLVADAVYARPEDILDFDLSLYDTTPACLLGLDDEFLQSGRLDDLGMVHSALTALLDSDGPSDQTRVMAIFDNEETGSGTKQGAASPVLAHLLERITGCLGGTRTDWLRAIPASFMISADNAHGFHPNYGEKYDPTNHPRLGGGPVIKINARCKYMTDADSAAVFRAICEQADVPCQYFVNHSDVAGGSTLGNILTSSIPLRGVDMGAPIWAMHSVRETMATADHTYTIRAFRTFYNL